MNVKTEERRTIVRTFAFDANEVNALDMADRICNSIRLGLDFEGAGEMISNFTGEVITYEDLARVQGILKGLILNDEHSWDLK